MAPHGKELSIDLKERVISFYKQNNGYKKIATKLKLSKNTVAKIVQNHKKCGTVRSVQKRPGRPCKLTPNSVRFIRRLVDEDPRKSAADVANEVKEVCAVNVSTTTIKRTLNKTGLYGRGPNRKPTLKSRHKANNLMFSLENKNKSLMLQDGGLWSEETKINQFASDDIKEVWCCPDEAYKESCLVPTVEQGGGNSTVWDSMTPNRTGQLRFIDGMMDTEDQCNVLKENMLFSQKPLERKSAFQHDDNTKDSAQKPTTEFLEEQKSTSGTNYPMFTIEQIELIRRLRNSGITKEQVVEAFERFDRIDQELGHLYTVPSSSASPTVNQQSSLQAPSIPSTSVGQPPLAHSSNSASHGHSMLLSRSNGQYPLYSGSRPSFSSSSPQSDNGQSDLKPPSNKRPREESTETNHEESMQEGNNHIQRAHNSVHNSMSLVGPRSLSFSENHSSLNQNSTMPNSITGPHNSPVSRVNDSIAAMSSSGMEDSQLGLSLENNQELEVEDLQEFMKQGMTKMYEEIKAFVNRVGLKQSQIAAMTGISQSYVSRYLRGEFTEMSERCRRAMYAWYVSHRQRLARAPRFAYGDDGFIGLLGTGGDAMDIQFTPKRERFTFREKHLEVLEAYFKENQYPSMELREEIAHLCNMALSSTGRELCEKEKVTPQIVSNWFNNRRKEMKKLAKEGGLDCSQILLPSRVRQRPYVVDLDNQTDGTNSERICTPSPKPSESGDDQNSFAADVAAVNRAISALSGEPLDGPIHVKQEPVSDSDEKSTSSQHSQPIPVE